MASSTLDESAPWWRGAVIYQIYPRSFADSDNDGIGDLNGITRHLDYVCSIGADAVWISPIYPSPQRDFGYDISDYCEIAAEYGSLEDFDRLLAEAHARGLRVILDQVLSHSSHMHPWFIDSVRNPTGPKGDWYIWADPKEDGSPPNNWGGLFNSSAWKYHPARRQYYLHYFLPEQPKLNLHNPDVANALLDVLRFWLDRGVDGFRLDVANTIVNAPTLEDNPPLPAEHRTDIHWSQPGYLQQRNDLNRHENIDFMERIRTLVDSYGDRFVIGEIGHAGTMLEHYANDDRALHSSYDFTFVRDRRLEPSYFRSVYADLATMPRHWPSVTFSNHDSVRPATRYSKFGESDHMARFAFALCLALKGTALIYQGEELGLPEAELAYADIRDPVGLANYPFVVGRDGCRTPMPWQSDAPNFGFSDARPWLPTATTHRALAIDVQENDLASTLNFARHCVALRRDNAALRLGDIVFHDTDDGLIAFERLYRGERALCLFNPTAAATTWPDAGCQSGLLKLGDIEHHGGIVKLGPQSLWIGA
jgi:alpha-glucosidase